MYAIRSYYVLGLVTHDRRCDGEDAAEHDEEQQIPNPTFGQVRGVALRIDSPGGDAIASDLLHRALTRLAPQLQVPVQGEASYNFV